MEELFLEKKRNIKRRLMEMSSSNSQVGAEVRRLHVIYFLSRKGRIEHPHLIRVHHHSRNGVHLRDVKRWLADLRGKDMPESFAWSYKMRYKSGYVWQDLLDEDLITPISDNEYVLKGSEISSSSPKEEANMEKKYSMQKREDNSSDHSPSFQEGHQDHHHLHLHHHQANKGQEEQPTKMPSSPEIIEEESHTFGTDKSSTLTEDYVDHQEEKQSSRSSCELSSKQEIHEEEEEEDVEVAKFEKPASLHPRKRSSKKGNNADVSSEEKTPASQPLFSKSKSNSNGGSLFRNLITCGAIDTNDSAMITVNRRSKASLNVEFSSSSKDDEDSTSFSKELLLKADKLGGSQRVSSETTNWLQIKQSNARKSFDGVRQRHEFGTPKAVNPAYKPIYGPRCLQCGKPFKPEKMHAHMKSCKGMKAWTRYSGPGISATAEKAVKTSAESQNSLIPGHCLPHSIDSSH